MGFILSLHEALLAMMVPSSCIASGDLGQPSYQATSTTVGKLTIRASGS